MQRPNILILYTDQQRWDGMGVNGNPDIVTPHLDQLAAEGGNFDHCFVQNPVCMPSRVSFLTGQYPGTLGITHMGVPVPEATLTLPRMLGPQGYTCANIGKLHFLPHANRDHRHVHPAYGFDHLEISDEPGSYEDAYRAWVRRKDPTQLPYVSLGLPPTARTWQQTMRLPDPVSHPTAWDRQTTLDAIPFAGTDEVSHTAFVAEQTIAYLRRAKDASRPFLCIAGFYSPHSPWVAPQRFLDLYDRDRLAVPAYPPESADQAADVQFQPAQLRTARHGYYAMISEVDFHVGTVLQALSDLNLEEETIVVFTSDHGEWLGEHCKWGKGYPGEDAVSRVPLLIRIPGQKQGQRISHIVESVDVVPTLLELAGCQIPPPVQGHSLLPFMQGAARGSKDDALMEMRGWKSLRNRRYRYVMHAHGRECLWDLQAEYGQYRDVAGDVAYRHDLAAMRARLLQRVIRNEAPLERAWTY